jgi:GPH family glycoside/pentoside/hexuronide:cation symporter
MEEKVKLRTKISFGLSDFASCLSWGVVGTFLMIYYTDVAKIPAAAVGTLFLVTRIWDAVNDPMMGIIIDRTNTRWGKCRPYFLWICVPLAILMVATFTVPDIGSTGKLIYAYVTFILLTMAYTAINIPVTAILPRLTKDPNQRTILGVFRMYGALIGNVLVGMVTLGLVAALGSGDDSKGYTFTLGVYGVLSILLFLIVFANVKETAAPANDQNKVPFRESIKAAKGNLPWLIAILMGFTMNLMQAMRLAGQVYYFTYNLGMPGLIPAISMVGLTMIVSLAVLPLAVRKWGKKKTVIIGNIVAIVGFGAVALSGTSMLLLFGGSIIGSIGVGFGFGLVFTLIADAVDYGEWINGVRTEGFLSAACSFGMKLGTGVGTAAAAWILALGHYAPGVENQASSALTSIAFNFTIVPVITAVISIVLISFWKVDKLMPQIISDLAAGRTRDQGAV